VEAWVRFHISRGFKLFLFDRYAFHRDIVSHAVQPWAKRSPVAVMLDYIDPNTLPAEKKKNNLGPVPKNDPRAYVSYERYEKSDILFQIYIKAIILHL
jgi:hypothetical protein